MGELTTKEPNQRFPGLNWRPQNLTWCIIKCLLTTSFYVVLTEYSEEEKVDVIGRLGSHHRGFSIL